MEDGKYSLDLLRSGPSNKFVLEPEGSWRLIFSNLILQRTNKVPLTEHLQWKTLTKKKSIEKEKEQVTTDG